jgi:hypothetical protein
MVTRTVRRSSAAACLSSEPGGGTLSPAWLSKTDQPGLSTCLPDAEALGGHDAAKCRSPSSRDRSQPERLQ